MAAFHRVLPISSSETILRIPKTLQLSLYASILFHKDRDFLATSAGPIIHCFSHCFAGRRRAPSKISAGWFSGFSVKKESLPEVVKAGDPVLHEPAVEVPLEEIGSEKIQKIIDDMIGVMRNAPGVGLAAPQIGIPLRYVQMSWTLRDIGIQKMCSNNNCSNTCTKSVHKVNKLQKYAFILNLLPTIKGNKKEIIVLEDTTEYISYAPKNETGAQGRRSFDLLVIINPKLEKKGNKTALFFEGCLSVDGFRAMVERHLQVEVTGHSRFGQPIKIDSSGWMARILQHEFDHLNGTIYVDKIVPRTFRKVENLDLPLPVGCPKPGVYNQGL